MNEMLKRARRAAPAVLFVVVALVMLAACAPITPEAPSGEGTVPSPTALPAEEAATEIPTVTIEVSDAGLVAPAEVPSGIVRFAFVGIGPESFVDVGRIVEQTSTADLEAALATAQDDPTTALELVRIYGYSSFSNEAVYELPAGDYVAVLNVGEPSQQIAYFTAGDESGAAAPQADVVVELHDFAFVMPDTVPAGENVWEFDNLGEQWHMMLILQPAEGQSADDIMAMMMSEEPPPEGAEPAFIGEYAPMSEGARAWVTVDLPPGDYMAICPLPDLTDMQMDHAAQGMVRMFTVE
jgi:hypothetical protein